MTKKSKEIIDLLEEILLWYYPNNLKQEEIHHKIYDIIEKIEGE